MSKSTKSKRDAHFKKGTAMDDDNPNAYKPAPGDKSAKTKPSKYTKDYEKMFGENAGEIGTDKLKKKYEDDTPLEELFGRNVDLSGRPFLSNFDGVVNGDIHRKIIRRWVKDVARKKFDVTQAQKHLTDLVRLIGGDINSVQKTLFKIFDRKALPTRLDYRKTRTFMKADVTHDRKDLAKRITEARRRLKK